MFKGTVGWFHDSKGYGLISSHELADPVLIHYSELPMEGHHTVKPSAILYFRTIFIRNGLRAIDVYLPEEFEFYQSFILNFQGNISSLIKTHPFIDILKRSFQAQRYKDVPELSWLRSILSTFRRNWKDEEVVTVLMIINDFQTSFEVTKRQCKQSIDELLLRDPINGKRLDAQFSSINPERSKRRAEEIFLTIIEKCKLNP